MFNIFYKNMFSRNNKINVNISELVLYTLCPRKVYYAQKNTKVVHPVTISRAEHLMLKEMAMSYYELLNVGTAKDECLRSALDVLLSKTLEEIVLIYPEEMEDLPGNVIEEAAGNLRAGLGTIGSNLTALMRSEIDMGLLRQPGTFHPGSLIHSEKLGLSGIPGGILNIEGVRFPVIIKTGTSPDQGMWANDRIHLAAFAMLQEGTDAPAVKNGIVIYARQGHIRVMSVRSDDRRQVLNVLSKVRKIKEGAMPERKDGPLCEKCSHAEACQMKASSFASKFF